MELDRFEKFILVFIVFAMLFDAGSTIYFSRLIGIEGEYNIIVKLLIQNQEWKWLFRYALMQIVFGLFLVSIPLYLRRKLEIKKYESLLIILIPLVFIAGGLSWFYAYFIL